jgi:hypothetical protein
LLFNFALEYVIRNDQEYQVRLELNGTHQLLVYAGDIYLLGDYIDTIKKNRATLIDASKEDRDQWRALVSMVMNLQVP